MAEEWNLQSGSWLNAILGGDGWLGFFVPVSLFNQLLSDIAENFFK